MFFSGCPDDYVNIFQDHASLLMTLSWSINIEICKVSQIISYLAVFPVYQNS